MSKRKAVSRLEQRIAELTAQVDALSARLASLEPQRIVIKPQPLTPIEAGLLMAQARHHQARVL